MLLRKEDDSPEPNVQTKRPLDPSTAVPLELKTTPGYYPGLHALKQQKFWDAATRKLVFDRVGSTPPIRFFTPAEAATMQAVVDRVLPQDDRTEATRIAILPGIDDRLFSNRIEGYRYEDMPSDQDAYRIAIKAIEAIAQKIHGTSFHNLETMKQEEILQSLHDEKPEAAEALLKAFNLKRFWSMLVSDCCAVYYAHPYAWDEIGFGGPAYPRGYMRLEGGEAEPWEVDEQRYDWLAPEDTISDRPQPTND
ncbi:gluconate 2-dehydrogenase subunit 3 family protein [Acidicapsa ligni]|uniref:gluconate 2-dehydrogenase subunit 3 family protein n=1 Tax=Acidicapsa ligni TaxID=542300 RepID=UPI0021E06B6F|nr:gluconate 2-dehydrogenase subunit 3 family protein [Acidicapsa ligni]